MPHADQIALQRRVDALRTALTVAPEDVALTSALAETLLELEAFGEAVIEFRFLAAAMPGEPRFRLGLARAYIGTGQRDVADIILDQLSANGELLADVAAMQADQGHDAEPDGNPGIDRRGRRDRVTFDDVGGLEDVKNALRIRVVVPRTHPDLVAAYGRPPTGNILMYGPPGCGKTYLARATAGELGARFLPVGIDDILDVWIAGSVQSLHATFEEARALAPTVLFFDELDALGADRAMLRQSGLRALVNQFLAELDDVSSSNAGVLIMGATNAPWHVDPAFRRPGRFDDVVFVPPPDAEARRRILKSALRDRPVATVDLDRIVAATDGCSGADTAAVVERAAQAKLQEAIEKGAIQPLDTKVLLAAVQAVQPSTREWFATARNYVTYANQTGAYDAVKPYLSR